MSSRHSISITAMPDDIDQLGHVNNAVWVRWIQDVAAAHWHAVARPEHQETYVWVVIRHEIDYRGNVTVGQTVRADTWVGDHGGARFDRFVRFTGPDGRVKVEAKTTWALVDIATGRISRLTPEIAAPFLVDDGTGQD
ncbi:acyl-CoA thioesterase [Sphingomonas sp. FW199]|uniref:acyl-CoA thioesterase n=1 Tax=Sphingomonas sp. FW199 TaxID=3400217 RepID=UPI003CF8EFFD